MQCVIERMIIPVNVLTYTRTFHEVLILDKGKVYYLFALVPFLSGGGGTRDGKVSTSEGISTWLPSSFQSPGIIYVTKSAPNGESYSRLRSRAFYIFSVNLWSLMASIDK